MRRIWILCALLMGLTAASALAITMKRSSRPMHQAARRVAGGSYLFGDRSVGPNADSNRSGVAESFPVTSRNSGTARSLLVYIGSGNHARRVVVGLYDNR